jgi:hypothetical protein
MTAVKQWRKWFGGRNPRGTVNPRGRTSRWGLRLEALEDRALPTATLYLDFGDNFTGANGLTTNGTNAVTEADFTGTVNGPDFGGVAGTDTLTFTSFAAEATNFGLTAAQTATMRSPIISLVQRYFARGRTGSSSTRPTPRAAARKPTDVRWRCLRTRSSAVVSSPSWIPPCSTSSLPASVHG